MTTDTAKPPRCPTCRSTDLEIVSYPSEFRPHGKLVVVDMLASRCASCGTEFTRAAQHTENLARMKARKAQYSDLLLGEEIFALRRRYGITQQAAAKIFGKGKIAFSRYENETSYPDASTTKLLKLAIAKPDVMKSLADEAGVNLPLWGARCEDERGAKVRVMFEGAADLAAQRWAQRELAAGGNRVVHDDRLAPFDSASWNDPIANQSANDRHYGGLQSAIG